MNFLEENTTKRQYKSPQIELIRLDNEISLALESDPPTYESENRLRPESFTFEPFRTT